MCHHSECGCEQHPARIPQHGVHRHLGYRCGSGHAPRRSPTGDETVGELEEDLKQLVAEAKGLEERISELKKKG